MVGWNLTFRVHQRRASGGDPVWQDALGLEGNPAALALSKGSGARTQGNIGRLMRARADGSWIVVISPGCEPLRRETMRKKVLTERAFADETSCHESVSNIDSRVVAI